MARKTVLVVDDEPEFVAVTKALIESRGYRVLTARDGEQGVQIARAEKPDLILLDVTMPRRDGFSSLYDLRHDDRTRAIPVILLTAMAERQGVRFSVDRVRAYMGEEPEGFLDKPVDPERLMEAIDGAIGPGEP